MLLRSPSSLHQIHTAQVLDLCITAVRMVYDNIEVPSEGGPVVFRHVGLGGSAASRPHVVTWLQRELPQVHAAVTDSREYVSALAPCLKFSDGGAFQNKHGSREFVKVARALFIDVIALHRCRMMTAPPPDGFGLRMHVEGKQEQEVPFDWDLLLGLLPSAYPEHVMSVHATAYIYARITTGISHLDCSCNWYQFTRCQLVSQGLLLVTTALKNQRSITASTTGRHRRPDSRGAIERQDLPRKPPVRKRVHNLLPPEEPALQRKSRRLASKCDLWLVHVHCVFVVHFAESQHVRTLGVGLLLEVLPLLHTIRTVMWDSLRKRALLPFLMQLQMSSPWLLPCHLVQMGYYGRSCLHCKAWLCLRTEPLGTLVTRHCSTQCQHQSDSVCSNVHTHHGFSMPILA